jgi:hypothetical protein
MRIRKCVSRNFAFIIKWDQTAGLSNSAYGKLKHCKKYFPHIDFVFPEHIGYLAKIQIAVDFLNRIPVIFNVFVIFIATKTTYETITVSGYCCVGTGM